MINANSIYFRFKFMATIYYWSLRLRGYRAKSPTRMPGCWLGCYGCWLVECD